MEDSKGHKLEIGATYCCVIVEIFDDGRECENFNDLVVYGGHDSDFNYPILLDADTLHEVEPIYDVLVRQNVPLREVE